MNWSSVPELYAVRLPEKLDSSTFEELLQCISPEKQEAIRGYYREEDKLRSLLGELLVRMTLMQRCGMKNEEIRFVYSSTGKPELAGAENLHFNVAHSGDWMVCAFDSQPIGVDIERIKPANLAISHSFFTEAEHLDICSATDPNARFFDYWTLKESFIKQSGKGLSQGLDAFGVVFKENGEIRIKEEGKELADVYLKQYDLEEGYKLGVCGTENIPLCIKFYSINSVIEVFAKSNDSPFT